LVDAEIFGIPVRTVNIPNIDIDSIINFIKSIEHQNGSFNSNAWSVDQQILKNPVFKDIVPFIKAQVQMFSIDCNHLCEEIKIINSWSNKLPSKKSIAYHWHENSYISGTIHLDNKGSFLIKSPEPRNLFNIDIQLINDNTFEIPSKPGQLVLFPSRVNHGVSTNNETERYSLAFNTWPTKFGDITKSFNWRESI
jgi:hypothetical protein